MTHIIPGEGKGKSGHSLMEALVNAIAKAKSQVGIRGDHKTAMAVIIDGYDFNGEDYEVSVKISVVDFDLAQDDIYHENDDDLEERREHSEEMSNAFYASSFGIIHHNPDAPDQDGIENVVEAKLAEYEEIDAHSSIEQNGLKLYASNDVHDLLANEIMQMRQDKVMKNDMPSLDLGGGGGSSARTDEAA